MMLCNAAAAVAGDQFLCIAEKATGFSWENGEWRRASFKTGDKHLVVEVPEYSFIGEKYNYEVRAFGSDKVEHRCVGSKSVLPEKGTRVLCGGIGFGFTMDTGTLRFQEYYGLGYVDGGDSNANTPYISIGVCSRLN